MPVNGKKWDRRIARARELAEAYPFARQILIFYSQLTSFQKGSYLQFPTHYASGHEIRARLPTALDEVDLAHLLHRWRPFLAMIEREAPPPLAEFAGALKSRGSEAGAAVLRAGWTGDPPLAAAALDVDASRVGVRPFERFCIQAFLQPFAEFLADHAEVPTPPVRLPSCPYCGSAPLVGVLRPEGEGAKRSLTCSFCRTEWDYLRIACPGCDERREEKLCVFTTPTFEGVRVEACATCKAYIKTVDLSRSGLAVPEVDELAAIPLTLWADEEGYQRIARGVFCL